MATFLKRRIAVIENDRNFRAIFRLLINASDNYIMVGESDALHNITELIANVQPDIILLGEQIIGVSSIEGAHQIKDINYRIDVVMLTVNETSEFVFEALRAGVSGFIPRNCPFPELLNHLNQIQRDLAPMSGRAARIIIDFI